MSRLVVLEPKVTAEHRESYKMATDIVADIDAMAEQHRELMGTMAVAGDRINGEVEHTFYDTLSQLRDLVITDIENLVNGTKRK